MRSYEEPKNLNKGKVSLLRPPYARRKPSSQPRSASASHADEQASQTKLARLIQEHRDLDAAISALFEARICDQLVITRMKKRKLQLKDEIALIES